MGLAVLLILFLVLVLVVLPVWVLVTIKSFKAALQLLSTRVAALEQELASGRPKTVAAPPPKIEPVAPPPPPAAPAPPLIAASVPPPPQAISTPPMIRAPAPVYVPPRPARGVNLEQFVGAKLFAWLGGLTAFLAVAFFVKYSFEHDLIPPEVRVAIGFALGAALVLGGVRITAEKYRVLAQAFCATGVVSLYAVTFVCRSVYHFAPFNPVVTFLLMALITAAAFLLAVRMNAQVVALLGLLGGFLTPILVSTGQDNPVGLFGYIALLDFGLVAVALHRRWHYLIPLGAAGTVFMEIAWTNQFFTAPRAPLAIAISLSFCALFGLTAELGRRCRRPSPLATWSAAALPLVALGFAFYFLSFPTIAARAVLLLGFIFAADVFLLLLAWRDELGTRLHLISGALVFLLLAVWTGEHVTYELLPWALAGYLVFAALHTAFPLVLERVRPAAAPTLWSQVFPPLTLLLMLVPLFKLPDVSLLYWPAILLIDLLAVGLAALAGSILAVGLVLVLTLAATAVCIFKTPTTGDLSWTLLVVIGGFAVFFFAAGLLLARRLGAKLVESPRSSERVEGVLGGPAAQIPAFAALLPFALLIMMSQRLALANPDPLFGLALLLVVLVLGLARLLVIAWLPACALAGLAALEYAWHARLFAVEHASDALAWYVGFYALFAAYPFVFRRRFASLTGPSAVAALSGVAQFPLVYRLIDRAWPNDMMGVLPALFALAPLASLIAVLRGSAQEPAARLNQLAWFGGVALLFITLIFPIQFERQWITIAWALEGAALLWLFHRVPHPGLPATGVVLLVVAFARLALNHHVFSYHARSDTPLFNWYLYTYGLAIAALFAGARLAAPPRDRVLNTNAPALLQSLGTILAFVLLNIEIADYFSRPGTTLTFEFSGSFARDMAYTIGWAVFALGLLGAGIWKRARAARYAAIGLLGVTLLKLFLHDLAQLGQLYRVGALIAVATVAIVASFLYQRFAPSDEPPAPPIS